MSGFWRFSIKVALVVTAALGGLLGATVILYRSFLFVHEGDVAKHIEPIFGRVNFEIFENDCSGFAARVAPNDQAPPQLIDFAKTHEKLARVEALRDKATDFYKLRPMKGEYLAFQNASISVVNHDLRGIEGIVDDMPDYIWSAIACWDRYDRKNQSRMAAKFKSYIGKDGLTVLLIGTSGHRFLVALSDKENTFIFGPSF